MPWRTLVDRWSIPFGLGCMVVAFAAGSSSATWAKSVGLDARWFVLFGVGCLAGIAALAQIWTQRRLPPRGLLRIGAVAAALLALAAVSTAWSVAPRLTVERAVSLALLFGLAAALASSTASDAVARLRALQGLAAGAIAVGVLGLVMLVVDYDAAVQQTTSLSPWRFRGFTENPNTISVLAAVSVPIITGLALRATGRSQQLWIAGALLLIGSTVGAESRGPLLAAFMGVCIVFLLAFPVWRPRLVGVTAALLVFGGGTGLRELSQPPQPSFTSAVAPAPPPNAPPAVPRVKQTSTPRAKPNASRPRTKVSKPSSSGTTNPSSHPNSSQPSGQGKPTAPSTTPSKTKAGTVAPHKNTGRPSANKQPAKPRAKTATPHKPKARPHKPKAKPHKAKPKPKVTPPAPRVYELPRAVDEIGNPALTKKNVSTAGSGRIAAWRGALDLIRERPLLGYGFGTEAKVFVDRWYYFQGGSTENSYLGLLLQLGVLGLGLVVALGLALLVRGLRRIPALDDEARPIVASLLGVLVAAAGIMVIQSFLYSVGNIATATVWISLFLLGTVVLEPARQREAVLVPAEEERGALVA
jgi:hypothetical protein